MLIPRDPPSKKILFGSSRRKDCVFFSNFCPKMPKMAHGIFWPTLGGKIFHSAVLKCWPRLPRGALRPGKCLPTAITPIGDKSLQRQVSGDNGWWTISFKKRLATDTPDNSLRRQTPHRTHYQKRQKRRIYAKECGRGGPAAGGHRQCETRGDGKSRGGEVGPPQQPSWASNSGPWENGKGRRPTRGWGWGCSPPFSDPVPPW